MKFRRYKPQDSRDPFSRYVWDSAWYDFWVSKNWKGRIVFFPILAIVVCGLLPMMLLGNLDKEKT